MKVVFAARRRITDDVDFPLGQNLLLARRLVEAGAGCVTVSGWVGPSPEGGAPLSAGGSVSAIKRELQAIHDLEERMVRIRRAIQHANQVTNVTIGKQARSIADWLVWRRDVSARGYTPLIMIRNL